MWHALNVLWVVGGFIGGEGEEPLAGGAVEVAGDVEICAGAVEGSLGEGEGAGLFEEVGAGEGAVLQSGAEEVFGEVELGFGVLVGLGDGAGAVQ